MAHPVYSLEICQWKYLKYTVISEIELLLEKI